MKTKQKNKRYLKFGLTVITAIIALNVLTTTPTNVPQASDTIKGIWVTHLGNSLLDLLRNS
jgi:uncharacterized lipoprotein YddW (UPF0748 family)